MDSIGDKLRQARTQRGMSLDDVATRTRISRKYLEAIEKGDRAAIPGGFFYKSFVRQYASTLGADNPDLVEDVEDLISAEQAVLRTPTPDDVLKTLASRPAIAGPNMASNVPVGTYVVLLFVVLVGCTGLYMWWHHTQQAHAEAAAQTNVARTEPPPRIQQPAAQPHPTQQQSGAEPASLTKEPQSAPQNPRAQTSVPPAAAAVLPGSAPIVLEITAADTTWFSVTADGKTVFADVLQPGQTKTFTAQSLARLRIGNAGGLDIKFNGKPAGPIGVKGQVRTVVATPTLLQVLQPPPEE